MNTKSTQLCYHINASREKVYNSLIDQNSIIKWKVPSGMTGRVHFFDGKEGGAFRISLTYKSPSGKGKTSEHTETYHGRFVKLVPNEQVVEVDEFETDNPDLRGEMTISITLYDSGKGTDLLAVHDGLPRGLSSSDNEEGWNESLKKLAFLVEHE